MLKFSDVKDNCLVTLKLHNGKGRPITIRRIFVNRVVEDYGLIYDTPTGSGCLHKSELEQDNTEILDVTYVGAYTEYVDPRVDVPIFIGTGSLQDYIQNYYANMEGKD